MIMVFFSVLGYVLPELLICYSVKIFIVVKEKKKTIKLFHIVIILFLKNNFHSNFRIHHYNLQDQLFTLVYYVLICIIPIAYY